MYLIRIIIIGLDILMHICVFLSNINTNTALQMRHILYHNSSGTEAFTGVLKQPELNHAITLHPVKNYTHLYRLHHYMQVGKYLAAYLSFSLFIFLSSQFFL